MGTKDLMIGDYFRVSKDKLCIKKGTIIRVRLIDANDKLTEKGLEVAVGCEPVNDDTQFSGGIWLNYLEPIPLTKNILGKNGWDVWFEHSTIARSISVLVEDNTNLSIQEVDGQNSMFVQLSHCGAGSFVFRKHLKYVHELQHTFRLVGLNELADNFKV